MFEPSVGTRCLTAVPAKTHFQRSKVSAFYVQKFNCSKVQLFKGSAFQVETAGPGTVEPEAFLPAYQMRGYYWRSFRYSDIVI